MDKVYYESAYGRDDELCHYGVKGMKWGVRRATKRASSATTQEQRDKAVASLNKHRGKAERQISKLSKQHEKLSSKYSERVVKSDTKAAKLEAKAAKKRRKANGLLTTDEESKDLKIQADMLESKAKDIRAKSELVKQKIRKNEEMQKMFNKGISDIDDALLKYGKKYVGA